MKKNTSFMFFIIAGLVLIGCVVFIFLIASAVQKTAFELADTNAQLQSAADRIAGAAHLKEEYKNLEPQFARIDKLFVDPQVPIDIIQFFENTARDTGLLFEITSAQPAGEKTDPWQSIGLEITLVGSFSKTLRLIDKVQSSPFLIEIQSFSVKVLTDSELKLEKYHSVARGDVSASLQVKVFTK